MVPLSILMLIYAVFAFPALLNLRRRRLDQVSKAVWALTVVSIPIMGAVALALVSPGEPRTPTAKADPRFELDEFRSQ